MIKSTMLSTGGNRLCERDDWLLLGKPKLIDTVPDDEWFFCETPQLTKLVTLEDLGDGDEPEEVILINKPNGEPEIDLYATAQQVLRWRKGDGVSNEKGLIVLKVGFLDGGKWHHDAVKKYVKEWLGIGLPLDLIYTQDKPHIRVVFRDQNYSSVQRTGRSVSVLAARPCISRVWRRAPLNA